MRQKTEVWLPLTMERAVTVSLESGTPGSATRISVVSSVSVRSRASWRCCAASFCTLSWSDFRNCLQFMQLHTWSAWVRSRILRERALWNILDFTSRGEGRRVQLLTMTMGCGMSFDGSTVRPWRRAQQNCCRPLKNALRRTDRVRAFFKFSFGKRASRTANWPFCATSQHKMTRACGDILTFADADPAQFSFRMCVVENVRLADRMSVAIRTLWTKIIDSTWAGCSRHSWVHTQTILAKPDTCTWFSRVWVKEMNTRQEDDMTVFCEWRAVRPLWAATCLVALLELCECSAWERTAGDIAVRLVVGAGCSVVVVGENICDWKDVISWCFFLTKGAHHFVTYWIFVAVLRVMRLPTTVKSSVWQLEEKDHTGAEALVEGSVRRRL